MLSLWRISLVVVCCCHIVLWMFYRKLSRDVSWKFRRMEHQDLGKEKGQVESFYTAWTYEQRMNVIRCRGLLRGLCVAREHTPRHTPAFRNATRDWLYSDAPVETLKLSTTENLIPEDRTIFSPQMPSCQERKPISRCHKLSSLV